jgi:4'-phosphopantetheinyl transferase
MGTFDPLLRWPLAPERIRLDIGHVQLWAASLNEFFEKAPRLGLLLSPQEMARADEFKLPEDRNRYVVRHGLLRLILSRYLQQPASAIEFRQGTHGKPEIQSGGTDQPPFFNTSHSSEIAVCAISRSCPLGVDVERIQEIPEMEAIAKRFFSSREARTLMALPLNLRLQAFYNCWTRKEAFLKATGEGIAENLAKVEVTLAPDDKPGVVSLSGDLGAHEQWQLQPFSPAHGYLGCVAYRSAPLILSEWSVTSAALHC